MVLKKRRRGEMKIEACREISDRNISLSFFFISNSCLSRCPVRVGQRRVRELHKLISESGLHLDYVIGIARATWNPASTNIFIYLLPIIIIFRALSRYDYIDVIFYYYVLIYLILNTVIFFFYYNFTVKILWLKVWCFFFPFLPFLFTI